MIQLSALPSPGLAVFPELITQKQETLIMKAESFTRSWKICLFDGTPILSIEHESFSVSRRKTVYDAQGRQLCQIRRKSGFGSSKYYAETTESSPKIWELISKAGFLSSKNTVSFANVVDGGRVVELALKNSGSRSPTGVVRLGETDVAVVDKESWKMLAEYHITVAEGMDMFLPVALVVALDDKARAARAGAAGAAGGGGGGGGGGC
jgi:uncharacterized protein YxjI